MVADDSLLPIDEVARRFGITASALRYYEKIELLRPLLRRSRRRYYGVTELRRLVLIQLLQHAGQMSLVEIAEITRPDPNGRPARSIIEARIDKLKAQIEATQSAERYLAHRLTCPRSNPIDDCPVLAGELEGRLNSLLR